MRSWYDGLGSGRGRLLGPPELGPIGPDASQDHGDLAGYGDPRLLRSDAPRQPRSPCLEGRPALHFREKDAGSLIKAGAGKSVPAFRYPALPVRFSGLIPSRRQSEIGSTSRARLNLFGSSIVERDARAVTARTPGTVMNRRNVRSSRTKRRISLSKATTLATATSRTSINFSMSADRTGWSWTSIRARWAKAPF